MALHLHDNDGTDDQHLIPGQGNIHWRTVAKKLREAWYRGQIALKVTKEFSQDFIGSKPDVFLKNAHTAAKAIGTYMQEY